MRDDVIQWLLASDEPWTRYRTLRDLQCRPDDNPDVQAARAALLADPRVQALIAAVSAWGSKPFKRHNDASYPIYAFSTLADFGVQATDPGMEPGIAAILAHQSAQGAFQSVVNIPKAFGGTGEDVWTWMLCDSPTLLYGLLSMGFGHDPRVPQAVTHVVSTIGDNGWRCVVAPELGKFKGPGRKADPCPVVNVFALKALAHAPEYRDSPAARTGVEMLLAHWAQRGQQKFYLFGIGTDFGKLKYPFVWYNILHVVEVLSHFPFVHSDPRFQEMLAALIAHADLDGRYTPTAMYQSWKSWPFSNKKQPSPWLTFLVLRILSRIT